MMRGIVFVFCVAVLACVNHALPAATKRDEMIQAAKGELNRRHINVPKDCIITVVDWVSVSAIQRPRESHLVRFERSHGRKREMLYAVVIDKRSGKVSEFLDYRGLTLGGPRR